MKPRTQPCGAPMQFIRCKCAIRQVKARADRAGASDGCKRATTCIERRAVVLAAALAGGSSMFVVAHLVWLGPSLIGPTRQSGPSLAATPPRISQPGRNASSYLAFAKHKSLILSCVPCERLIAIKARVRMGSGVRSGWLPASRHAELADSRRARSCCGGTCILPSFLL